MKLKDLEKVNKQLNAYHKTVERRNYFIQIRKDIERGYQVGSLIYQGDCKIDVKISDKILKCIIDDLVCEEKMLIDSLEDLGLEDIRPENRK